MTLLSDCGSLHLFVTRRLGMLLQNRGTYEVLARQLSWPTDIRGLGTVKYTQLGWAKLLQIFMGYVSSCQESISTKKVNFVKNVTYEVLSRQRRCAIHSDSTMHSLYEASLGPMLSFKTKYQAARCRSNV